VTHRHSCWRLIRDNNKVIQCSEDNALAVAVQQNSNAKATQGAIVETMFTKSLYASRKKPTSTDTQQHNRQKVFHGKRIWSSTPSVATSESHSNTASQSRSSYWELLFRNGISAILTPVVPSHNRTVVDKKIDDARSARLADGIERVKKFKVSEEEGNVLLKRVQDDMAQGVEESKAHVMAESDDEGMDVVQDSALVAARCANLNGEERAAVEKLLTGSPNDHKTVVVDKFNIDITVGKLVCLRRNTWLNDEVVNFYMAMLQERDARLWSAGDGARLPSHYFNSFFMTKLLENGQYNYGQVKRWSKKFDVFALDRVFIPINLNNTHWVMAVVYVQKKEIHYYDSMSGSGKRYLDAMLTWLVDEAREKKGQQLDKSQWKLIDREQNVPQQQNGYDCGVFSIMCADYVSDNLPLSYVQEDMQNNRVKIAAAIRRGHLTY
jgi:sentrin-specific protease 1